jgi:hypothetical protein
VSSSITIGAAAGVTGLVLMANDFQLADATSSKIDAGSTPVQIQQSVSNGSTDGSLTIGGAFTQGVNIGDLYIDQSELNRITTTSTLTIGGDYTKTLSVDDMAYGGSASHLLLLALGGVSSTPPNIGAVNIVGSASSSVANVTTIESTAAVTFAANITANGTSGLIITGDYNCAGAGVISVAAGQTVETTVGPLIIKGFALSLDGYLKSSSSSTSMSVCSGAAIDIGSDGSTSTASFIVDESELSHITSSGDLYFSSPNGSIFSYQTVSADTANIAGVITMNAAGAGGSIQFSQTSAFKSLFASAADGEIRISTSATVTTTVGTLSLSTSNNNNITLNAAAVLTAAADSISLNAVDDGDVIINSAASITGASVDIVAHSIISDGPISSTNGPLHLQASTGLLTNNSILSAVGVYGTTTGSISLSITNGLSAECPLTWQATEGILVDYSVAFTGTGLCYLSADNDDDGYGTFSLTGGRNPAVAVTTGDDVTALTIIAADFVIPTAGPPSCSLSANTAQLTMAPSATTANLFVGGTAVGVGASIDVAEVGLIATSGIAIFGGSTASSVTINGTLSMAVSPSEWRFIATSSAASTTSSVTVNGSTSSALATLVTIEANDIINIENDFSTFGNQGLKMEANLACSSGATGIINVAAGVTISTNNHSMILAAAKVDIDGYLNAGSGSTATVIVQSPCNSSGGIEIGGSAGPHATGRLYISAVQLSQITSSTITFTPASSTSTGGIFIYSLSANDTNGITGLVTLDGKMSTGGITFVEGSVWSSSLYAISGGVITVDSDANIDTIAGPLTLSSIATSTNTSAIMVPSLSLSPSPPLPLSPSPPLPLSLS